MELNTWVNVSYTFVMLYRLKIKYKIRMDATNDFQSQERFHEV